LTCKIRLVGNVFTEPFLRNNRCVFALCIETAVRADIYNTILVCIVCSPASRRRRRNGKSHIWAVVRDSESKMPTLVRASSNCKQQTTSRDRERPTATVRRWKIWP
jgi:hypothetical protein